MIEEEILRMESITKVYPNGVVANKDVTFSVNKGEIHALCGENGAGKSTLMKILFGQEQPTRGDIYIQGEKVNITSPTTAIKLGIGMVHQHFMLVDSLTAIENMVLGVEPTKGLMIDRRKALSQVQAVADKYNLHIDPNKIVGDLSVGQKQKLEILKALLRGAEILILDEPTAVLAPQETSELFVELKNLRDAGHSIIFISHKLEEVRDLCDRVTIIRRGESKGVYPLSEVTNEEISHLMVGRDVITDIEKGPVQAGLTALSVRDLCIISDEGRPVVNGISFIARKGEILGVAGVEGNGQSQLVEAITGLVPYQEGEIKIGGQNIKGLSTSAVRKLKVSHIPEDRMTIGVAPSLSITENMLADKISSSRFSSKLGLLNKKSIREYGWEMVKSFGIVAQNPDVAMNSLSGGNIQKAVLAREISSDPDIIVADQPSRGVDVGATGFIRKKLIDMRDAGKVVFLVTSDLNEVLGLSDRLLVMFEGQIAAYFPDASKVTEEELGQYMLGIKKQSQEQIKGAVDE